MLQQRATLTTTFSEVLANLAFMFVSQETADAGPGDLCLEASIVYRGALSGRLRLRCSQEFSRALTANLLGMDPENPEAAAKSDDALKELMNVLCGQYVTAAYGSDGVFNLGIPEVRAVPPATDPAGEEDAEFLLLHVDGQPVRIAHESTTP